MLLVRKRIAGQRPRLHLQGPQLAVEPASANGILHLCPDPLPQADGVLAKPGRLAQLLHVDLRLEVSRAEVAVHQPRQVLIEPQRKQQVGGRDGVRGGDRPAATDGRHAGRGAGHQSSPAWSPVIAGTMVITGITWDPTRLTARRSMPPGGPKPACPRPGPAIADRPSVEADERQDPGHAAAQHRFGGGEHVLEEERGLRRGQAHGCRAVDPSSQSRVVPSRMPAESGGVSSRQPPAPDSSTTIATFALVASATSRRGSA